MDVALWRCLFSQLFCFSLKSESDSNWKEMQRQDLPWYPVLSQKEVLETCYFNFGKLSRQDSKTSELEISSCRLTTAQSRCLARYMSTAIQACGRSRYVDASYVRSSHYLVRLRGVSRSNIPTLCKRLFDITELSLPTSLLVCLCFDFWAPLLLLT